MAKQSYLQWSKIEKKNRLLRGERYIEEISPPSFIGKVLMVFPGDYKIGMANLGYQHVMRLWLQEGFEVDRLFLDNSLEIDRSFEKEYPIESFDIIAITFPFESGVHKLVSFLRHVRSLPSSPIVVLGGATTYFNPFILINLVDYVIVGDGEGAIHSLVEHISSNAPLPPWIIKGNVSNAVVNKIFHINEPAHSLVIPAESVFEKFFLVEIGRGCHVGCRFCVYGYTYRPVRFFSPNVISQLLDNKRPATDTVGLISASLSLHPDAEDIVESVMGLGYRPVPSSLHVNESSIRLISLLAKSGNRSMTFAVEHGDRAFQRKIGKEVNPEHLNNLLRVGSEYGLQNVKLYFIMGLGNDPMYNAWSGVQFLKTALKGIRGIKVTVSFSVIVPKPWTPFENLDFPTKTFIKKEIKAWKKLVAQHKLPVRLILPSYNEAFEEYVISRLFGDLTEEYVDKIRKPKDLLAIANNEKLWKNLRHIDPSSFLDIEFNRYKEGLPPIGCLGDCASCMVKSIGKRGDIVGND